MPDPHPQIPKDGGTQGVACFAGKPAHFMIPRRRKYAPPRRYLRH